MPKTTNDFFIGSNGKTLIPLFPIQITSRQQAYRTAAWLKVLALTIPDDGTGDTYETIEEAINNS